MKLYLPCPLCSAELSGTMSEIRDLACCPHCDDDVGRLDSSLKAGDLVGAGYTILAAEGEDEFGVRYLAKNAEGNEVHLKMIAPAIHQSSEGRSRFLREIKLLSSLRHPGIVSALDSGEDEGVFYMSFEREEGISLDEYMKTQESISETDAVNLILPVIDALTYVWGSQQIVHRDIKPCKIFITDNNTVKISDLGLAKSFSDDSVELTGAGFTMGTPDYMSPEQVNGDDLDFKADMYSLGLVLYELVTGTRAFEGSVMEVLNRQLTEMPPRASTQNSSISESCSGVIDRMIQKAAADRYHTWGACSDALKLVIASTVCDVDVLGKSSLSMPTNDDLVNASGIILDDDSLKEGTVEVREFKAVEAGFIIGNGYEIDRKIGDGAMGEIFLAVDEEKDRLVQVKLLSPSLIGDREKVERLLQEMDITSSLSHPNLLSVIEGGEDNGRYYLVTEYEDGITLEDYLGRYAPLDERDALDFLVQISQVLSYAWHEKKLLHREIKPSNILVNEDTKQVKLTDFGVAKSLEGDSLNLTGVGFTIGSPEYMSPEQVRGDEDIDSRSDMYAVGLVLYEALAGRKPFQAESVMALMNMQMTEQHKSLRNINPKVSKPCSDLVDRLLAKNRDQRYSTWSEMLKAMKKARAGEAVTQIDLSNTLPRDGVAFPAQQTAASPGFQRTRTGSHLDVLPPIEKRGRSNMKLWLVVSVAVLILLIILLLNN